MGRHNNRPRAGARLPGARVAAAVLTAVLLVAGLPFPAAAMAAAPTAAGTGAAPVAAAALSAFPPALPAQPPLEEFVPPPECQGQHAALLAVRADIDAHNARPHKFRVPAQAAQLAACDAEANQLNTAQQTAATNLELCLQTAARNRALAALAGSLPGGPPVQTTAPDATRRQLDDVRRRIPSNWTPPPPSPGRPWRVDTSSPVRPLYDVLRRRNPGDIGDVSLRGVPRPQIGDPDPAYPSDTIGRLANGRPSVSPDHVVSLAELVQMPGFTLLSPDNMYAVANAPLNLQWLSRQANRAKGSKSVADMSGVDPQWQTAQIALENEVRGKLQDLIAFLLLGQGEG